MSARFNGFFLLFSYSLVSSSTWESLISEKGAKLSLWQHLAKQSWAVHKNQAFHVLLCCRNSCAAAASQDSHISLYIHIYIYICMYASIREELNALQFWSSSTGEHLWHVPLAFYDRVACQREVSLLPTAGSIIFCLFKNCTYDIWAHERDNLSYMSREYFLHWKIS